MQIEDQREFYWTHPPRCVNDFQATRADLGNHAFDGHGEDLNTVFSLACRCGRERHFILGYYWRNPGFNNVLVFVGPLALRCESCGKTAELIDTDLHGHDGEQGHGSATKRGEGDRSDYECPQCGSQPFDVVVRFEYPDDLFEEDYEDQRGREQDLFTWFSLVGTCSACSERQEITDFECA